MITLMSCRKDLEQKPNTFICPPCDHPCDDKTFSQAGNCPACQMPLIPQYSDNREFNPADKVDELLSPYIAAAPGMAIGVIKNGELILAKGYGAANLDYNIPITPDSRFYIGSMAKQFTGAALLKLESEGQINFQDPVYKYLPDFPRYPQDITLDHLIHHTSGVRCTSSMQLIAGINQKFEEHFTAEEQYQMIIQQKELNFEPGTQYRYSSGGYIVLAKVVEQASGMSFRAYLQKNIFEPLGMDQSFVIDDHNEIVENRVVSYWPDQEGGFERRSLIFDGKGDGSILTTVKDLAKWDKAFYEDTLLGIPDFADRMYQKGQLKSGEELDYGMALISYEHKGHFVVSHNGGMLGFSADMLRFPKEKLSIIVLANRGGIYSTGMAIQIADIFLKEKPDTLPSDSWERDFINIDASVAKKYAGKFFSEDMNNWRRITYDRDTLFFDMGSLNERIPMQPLAPNEFMIGDPKDPTKILFLSRDTILIKRGIQQLPCVRFDDSAPKNIGDLQRIKGTYYSSELNTYYTIFQEDYQLKLRINNNAPIVLFPDPSDKRINWNSLDKVWIGFAMMKFITAPDGEANGFSIGDNRVKGIFFEKILHGKPVAVD